MALKEFLKSKVFVKHLVLIISSFLVLIFITSFILKIYTRHGKEFQVPNITGLNIKDVEASNELEHFEIMIMDSIYKEGVVSGTILLQDPSEGSMVKHGRKIYITIASYSGDMIQMPLCKDKSLSNAVKTLVDVGLRVGTIMFRNGEIDNVVVEQRYKGKNINVGSDVLTGESIDLIVEVSSTTKEVYLPNIASRTEKDAEIMLWKAGLNVGRKIYQGKNGESNSRVIGYSPSNSRVMIGTAINLNLMNDNEKSYKKQVEDFQQSKKIEEEIEKENDTLSIEQNTD